MTEHDPLSRQLPKEPRFVLLGRDQLASGLTRLWAALFSQNAELADDIYRNLKFAAGKLPYMPNKQSTHAVSAREVANQMDCWRMAQEAQARQPIRTEPVK